MFFYQKLQTHFEIVHDLNWRDTRQTDVTAKNY